MVTVAAPALLTPAASAGIARAPTRTAAGPSALVGERKYQVVEDGESTAAELRVVSLTAMVVPALAEAGLASTVTLRSGPILTAFTLVLFPFMPGPAPALAWAMT